MRLFFNLIKSNALLLCRHLNQPNVGGNQVKHKHLGQKRSFNNNKKKSSETNMLFIKLSNRDTTVVEFSPLLIV